MCPLVSIEQTVKCITCLVTIFTFKVLLTSWIVPKIQLSIVPGMVNLLIQIFLQIIIP